MKYTQELAELLKVHDLLAAGDIPSIAISGISNDSRQVKSGDLFICKGYAFKPEYLHMAAQRGAVCYMAQQPIEGVSLPCLLVNDVRKAQSLAAIWFYDDPSASLTMIGVTGTKGKSTTAGMTQAIMNAITGHKTGLISGVSFCVGCDVDAPVLTTPESLDFQHLLSLIRDNGLGVATTEISSQSYKVHRVYGLHFDYGVFLNISPDHLGEHEHPDMADYLACKLELLKNSDTAIINIASDYFDTIYATAKSHCKRVLLVGNDRDECDYNVHDIQKQPRGYSFLVSEKKTGQTHAYSIAMEGQFNITNAVAAIAIGREEQGDPAVIADALADAVIAGRADFYHGSDLRVLVSYMHNGISCRSALDGVLQDFPGSYITIVQGMSGSRSELRLHDLGDICGKYADRLYCTSENPTFDDPLDLCMRLAHASADGKAEIVIEPNRSRAIERAICEAPADSIVVVGGKGNEEFQIVGADYVYYESDPVAVKRALDMREKQHG
ncbi:MAG: UDP-N-acetylmuramyl-tripeptide synthetase [Eubacteriales bacterium]|nr:UDP-N-acetylmuramyl-tripeptide synthetase [Eubacteriales bacterium]